MSHESGLSVVQAYLGMELYAPYWTVDAFDRLDSPARVFVLACSFRKVVPSCNHEFVVREVFGPY